MRSVMSAVAIGGLHRHVCTSPFTWRAHPNAPGSRSANARLRPRSAHHIELVHATRDAPVAQFQTGRASAQDPLQAEIPLAYLEHNAAALASRRDVTVAQRN